MGSFQGTEQILFQGFNDPKNLLQLPIHKMSKDFKPSKQRLFLNQRSEDPIQMPPEMQRTRLQSPKIQKIVNKNIGLQFLNSKISTNLNTHIQSKDLNSNSLVKAAILRENNGDKHSVIISDQFINPIQNSLKENKQILTLSINPDPNQDKQSKQAPLQIYEQQLNSRNSNQNEQQFTQQTRIITHEQRADVEEANYLQTIGEPTVNDTKDLSPPGSAIDTRKIMSRGCRKEEYFKDHIDSNNQKIVEIEQSPISPIEHGGEDLKQINEEYAEKGEQTNAQDQEGNKSSYSNDDDSNQEDFTQSLEQFDFKQSPLQQIIEREKNLILEQMKIQQQLDIQERALSAMNFSNQHHRSSSYAAYSKLKHSRHTKRSVTPLLISNQGSVQISPRSNLITLDQNQRKQSSGLKKTLNQQSMDSCEDAINDEEQNNSNKKTNNYRTIIVQTKDLGRTLPNYRDRIDPFKQRKMSIQSSQFEGEKIDGFQQTSQTFDPEMWKTYSNLNLPQASEEIMIELNQLDEPIYLKRFEELVSILNPFSVNQIQQLSPRNNKMIDRFMDTKKWQKFKYQTQQQFDTALSQAIGEVDDKKESSKKIIAEPVEKKQLATVTIQPSQHIQTMEILQSKLSDQTDIETAKREVPQEQVTKQSKFSSPLFNKDKTKIKSVLPQQKTIPHLDSAMESAKVLFKTKIRVSPVERNPTKMTHKDSTYIKPLKVRYKGKRQRGSIGEKRFNNSKEPHSRSHSKEMRPNNKDSLQQWTIVPMIDADQLKYKLDTQPDDTQTDSMIRIQAMDIGSRLQVISNLSQFNRKSNVETGVLNLQIQKNYLEMAQNDELQKNFEHLHTVLQEIQTQSQANELATNQHHGKTSSLSRKRNSPPGVKRALISKKNNQTMKFAGKPGSKYFTIHQDTNEESKTQKKETSSKMNIYSSAQTEGRDVLSSAGQLQSQFEQSQGIIYIADKQSLPAIMKHNYQQHSHSSRSAKSSQNNLQLNKVDNQNKNGQPLDIPTPGFTGLDSQKQVARKEQIYQESLVLPIPQTAQYLPAHRRQRNNIGLAEWSQESHASEDKSRCNTITFGSNNPRSRDSVSALDVNRMLIKGKKLGGQDKESDIKIEGMSYELCNVGQAALNQGIDLINQKFNQNNQRIRKIQIREREKKLQSIKDQLKQIQLRGSINYSHQNDQTSFKSDITKGSLKQRLRTRHAESIGNDVKRFTSTNRQTSTPNSSFTMRQYRKNANMSLMSQFSNQNQQLESEVGFLQKMNQSRQNGHNLKTSQGIRMTATIITSPKETINYDIISINENNNNATNQSKWRKLAMLPPIQTQQRQRSNNKSLLQPLGVLNQHRLSLDNEVIEGSKINPSVNQQKNYHTIVAHQPEEKTDGTSSFNIQEAREEQVQIVNKEVNNIINKKIKANLIPQQKSSLLLSRLTTEPLGQRFSHLRQSGEQEIQVQIEDSYQKNESDMSAHSKITTPVVIKERSPTASPQKINHLDDLSQEEKEIVRPNKLPTPLPDNIMIQLEETQTQELENIESSIQKQKKEPIQIINQIADNQQQQTSFDSLQQKIGTGMMVSVTEIMTMEPSKELLNVVTTDKKNEKNNQGNQSTDMQEKKLKSPKKRRSSLISVQISPRKAGEENKTQSRFQKKRIQIRQEEHMDPSECNLMKRNHLQEIIRKQSNIRRTQQSDLSINNMQRSTRNQNQMLRLTNTINYVSCSPRSPREQQQQQLELNMFPALAQEHKEFVKLVNMKQNMDLANIDFAAQTAIKTSTQDVQTSQKILETSETVSLDHDEEETPKPNKETLSVVQECLSVVSEIRNVKQPVGGGRLSPQAAQLSMSPDLMQIRQMRRSARHSTSPVYTEQKSDNQQTPLSSAQVAGTSQGMASRRPTLGDLNDAFKTSKIGVQQVLVTSKGQEQTQDYEESLDKIIDSVKIQQDKKDLNEKGKAEDQKLVIKRKTINVNKVMGQIQANSTLRDFSPLLAGKTYVDKKNDHALLNDDSAVGLSMRNSQPTLLKTMDERVNQLNQRRTSDQLYDYLMQKCDSTNRLKVASELQSIKTPFCGSVVTPTMRLTTPLRQYTQNRIQSGKKDVTTLRNKQQSMMSRISDPRQIYQEIFSEKGAVNLNRDGSINPTPLHQVIKQEDSDESQN